MKTTTTIMRTTMLTSEFDGPLHFLASRAPTGATLLKRQYLQLLGHTLVSVPYWEWERCQGADEREQYLRSKLDGVQTLQILKNRTIGQ